ncbi:MAG: hypothetical protein ABI353_22475 [Isosphaeraceae bacterium]
MPTIAFDDLDRPAIEAAHGPASAFLIRLGADRLVFYTEDHIEPLASSQQRPARGWFRRNARVLAAGFWRLGRTIGLPIMKLRALLRWGPDPEESLLRRLRHADAIRVHHPASISDGSAREAWLAFLAKRRTRHLIGLLVNAMIAPFTLLLIPLPGPNIIGFWFVYRVLAHFWALLGLRRARALHATIEFLPTAVLDTPITSVEDQHIPEIEQQCGLRHLRAYLKRRGTLRGIHSTGMNRPCGS